VQATKEELISQIYYIKNIDFIEIVKKKDTVIKKTNEKEAGFEARWQSKWEYNFLMQKLGRRAKVQNLRI